MKTLFFLGHPAHYHLFKNTIKNLRDQGVSVDIVIKTKDILVDLLDSAGESYTNLLPNGRKDGKFGIINGVIRKERALYRYCKINRPDLMIGVSAEIAHVGKILGIPSMNATEDDFHIVKQFGRITYPFTDHILSPAACDNGKWNYKTVSYPGYQKLAYLHPNQFRPDRNVVNNYLNPDRPFFILRLAKLSAYHDNGIEGFGNTMAKQFIEYLSTKGEVYITSERELPAEFEQYKLRINPLDIHHLLYFAKMFVGDSQSMAVESAVLGTPSIRFSSFTGRIGVLEELENKYQLTKGVHPKNPDELFSKTEEMLCDVTSKEKHQEQRASMLRENIDVTAFFTWLILNYPGSLNILKKEPDYHYTFLEPHLPDVA